MRHGDLAEVVRIHLLAFPTFFLSSLGTRFLRVFYAGFLGKGDAIALVVESEPGTILGFVAGTAQAQGFYRRLLRERVVRLVLAALPVVLTRPTLVFALRRRLSNRGHENVLPPATAGLLSLAVDPARQRGGAGAILVQQFLQAAYASGATGVALTTDAEHNDAVNHFYRSKGFQLMQTFSTAEGRRMHEYYCGASTGV